MTTIDDLFRGAFELGASARRKGLPREMVERPGADPLLAEEVLRGWDSEDAALQSELDNAPPGHLVQGNVLRTGTKGGSKPPFLRAEPDDFIPSSEDKRIADESGKPVRVSVFDRSRTTIMQCLALRGLSPGSPVFTMPVAKICKVANPGNDQFLCVVEDPLPHPLNLKPGASGHCGIEGLVRCGSREKYRDFLSHLVDIAVPAKPSEDPEPSRPSG